MLTLAQSIILGALQGVSELFPVSSLGHSVLFPAILGWHVDEQAPAFLIFLVATHLATALVLFIYYWRDWSAIIRGIFRSLAMREIRADDRDAKLGWLLIVSTIPAGLLGLLFEQQIRKYFIAPRSAAIFLTLNGILLWGAELLRRRSARADDPQSDGRIARLSWSQGLKVGTLQALALLPGFSRTGASLAGGLLVGLSHEDALRFSFLLATPIIGAAAALKLPKLIGTGAVNIGNTLAGAAVSAVFAYLSILLLSRYFNLEKRTLKPFALYCLIAGMLSLLLLH